MSKITEKSVIGAFDLIKRMANGSLQNEVDEVRKDVFKVEENGWIVDTCEGFDTHKWETGINRGENWLIVEQYSNRIEAQKGHDKWVALMRENPKRELPDINVWETEDWEDE